MGKKRTPSVVTVGLDAELYERVRAYQDVASRGELGHLSIRQALASLVAAGLAAKGAS